MKEMTMLSVDEALAVVRQAAKKLKPVTRPFQKTAGWVLAETVRSREAIPPFDNSAVDGYAVRSSDTTGASPEAPVFLAVIAEVSAGQTTKRRVNAGQAVRIMTGAPLPKGADAIVMVEQTQTTSDGRVAIRTSVVENENRRFAGDDIRKGQIVFSPGHVVRPFDIGVLASIGKTRLKIIPKPSVAIVSTGDELVLPGRPMKPGAIRASSNFALKARLESLGFDVLDVGIARDTKTDLRKKFSKALRADAILTTGGVSMGEKDLVRDVLRSLGVSIRFWKVKQKPGKPLVFGTRKEKLFFGLPGNPVSSLICFELFGLPALMKMAGTLYEPHRIEVKAGQTLTKKPGLRQFMRAKLERRNGEWFAVLTGNQSSGVLSSLSAADVLLDWPEAGERIGEGERVSAIVLSSEALRKRS